MSGYWDTGKTPQLSIVVKFAIDGFRTSIRPRSGLKNVFSLLFCFKRKDRVQEFSVPFPRFRVQHVALSDRTTVAVDVLLLVIMIVYTSIP